jgi:hypothetical protein
MSQILDHAACSIGRKLRELAGSAAMAYAVIAKGQHDIVSEYLASLPVHDDRTAQCCVVRLTAVLTQHPRAAIRHAHVILAVSDANTLTPPAAHYLRHHTSRYPKHHNITTKIPPASVIACVVLSPKGAAETQCLINESTLSLW